MSRRGIRIIVTTALVTVALGVCFGIIVKRFDDTVSPTRVEDPLPVVEPGQVWVFKPDNPFAQDSAYQDTVIAVSNGYVQYDREYTDDPDLDGVIRTKSTSLGSFITCKTLQQKGEHHDR